MLNMSSYRPSSLSDLAFIDVETTGLNDQEHRVIEVAVARVRPDPVTWDTPLAVASFRFTPSSADMAKAEPAAFKTNGFYLGHPDWADALPIDSDAATQAWNNIAKITRKATIVAQNVPFDRGFMWEELKRRGLLYKHEQYGLLPPWERRFVELQSFSWLIAQEKGLGLFGLHHAYAAMEGPELIEHRAEADVKRGMAVMRHVYRRWAFSRGQ
jgi:hypothetical protein